MALTLAKRLRVYKRDGYRCQECGKQMHLGHPELTLDHRRPKVGGGTNAESNLVTMCGPCNRRKGPRWDGPPAPRRDRTPPPKEDAGPGSTAHLRALFPMDY